MLESLGITPGWLRTTVILAGAVLITVYVVFGGPSDCRRRRRKKKDHIPGLANVGNSCFLNALVQGLASCPLFIKWLDSKLTDSSPPLVLALHNLLKVLNNEGGLDSDACAGEVMRTLRSHGWVISSEEQDTHELFHALTATIDDELISHLCVPSLLDVSWVEASDSDSQSDSLMLNVVDTWEQNNENYGICEEVLQINIDVNTQLVHKDDASEMSCMVNGVVNEDNCDKKYDDFGTNSFTTQVNHVNYVNSPNCSNEDYPRNQKLAKAYENQAEMKKNYEEKLIIKVDSNNDIASIENVCGSGSSNQSTEDFGCGEELTDKPNCKSETLAEKCKAISGHQDKRDTAVVKASIITRTQKDLQHVMQDHWKNRSDQHDSPFRGYLASQLQCTMCGFKNPAQWANFESLSLSLPSVPWGEVTLQELLDSYITQEKVTDVTCDGCTKTAGTGVKTSFTKQLTVGKLPECLCFHIKRTVWLENGSAVKRRDHVIFPEFLTMDPYTYTTSISAQGQQSGLNDGMESWQLPSEMSDMPVRSSYSNNTSSIHLSSIMSQNATISQVEPSSFLHVTRVRCEHLYRLKAVIVHVGDVFCGHFVTYRRGSIGSRTRNRWFYTSDLLVREASLDEVRKSNAYMILYEKVTK